MRSLITVLAIGLVTGLVSGPPAASQEKSEWADLFAKDCRDWSRDAGGKSPWRMTAERTLVCDAAADVLGPDRAFGDGTLKFEYRFRPAKGKDSCKAGVYVRGRGAASWCRLALGDDCGALTSTSVGGSDRPQTFESPGPAGLAREPGYWNLVKVSLRGQAVDLFVNGRLAASFTQAEAGYSRIAFEAAGSEVEFRRVVWKESK